MSVRVEVERTVVATGRPAITEWARERRASFLLGALLLGTLLKGVMWTGLIFPFDAPDEPSHFNYVMQVHTNHTLPVIVMTTPNTTVPPSTPQDSMTRTVLDRFGFTAFRGRPYESSQPPLFYVVAALLIAPMGEGRLTLMYAARLASVLFGVGAVWALWWGVRALWPGAPLVVWGAPLALTLHPEFTFVTSTITNDAAALFFGALLFAVWAAGLRALACHKKVILWQWGLIAGAVTGLGLLTKLTMIVTLPGTLLWLWWLVSGQGVTIHRLRRLAAGAVAAGIAILLLVGWWVARNLQIYGEPTGTRSILGIYHGIYWRRRGFPENQLFSFFPLDDFGIRGFRSFWAAYDWSLLTLDWWVYAGLLLLSLCAIFGIARAWLASRNTMQPGQDTARRRIVWLSVITLLAAAANMLFYNSFVDYQPQGRYLFVALAPTMLLILLGLRHVTRNRSANRAIALILPASLAVLQLISIPALLKQWTHMVKLFG